jgi:hypothetical protein
MPTHLLAWTASAAFAARQSVESSKLQGLFLATGLLLLLAAWHIVYALFTLAIAGLAAVQQSKSNWLLPWSLALRAVNHTVTCWLLPIVGLWGLCGAWEAKELFAQEIGHVFNSTFEFVALFVLPVLANRVWPSSTRSDDTASSLWLQKNEGLLFMSAGFGGGLIEFYFLWIRDFSKMWAEYPCETNCYMPPEGNYGHMFTALSWGFFGLYGFLSYTQGQSTSFHVVGAAMIYGIIMSTHAVGTLGEISKDVDVWLLMHRTTAFFFIFGSLVRLVGKKIDAACIFFLAAACFTCAARDICHAVALHFMMGHTAVMALVPVGVAVMATQVWLLNRLGERWLAENEGASEGYCICDDQEIETSRSLCDHEAVSDFHAV